MLWNRTWLAYPLLVCACALSFPHTTHAALDQTTYGPERQSHPRTLKLEPTASDGSFQYTYPFAIPPGRNGLAPEATLSYSSRDTQATSPFGYGWSLSIPHIERNNKRGTNTLYTRHDFTSSWDGELVATSTATSSVGYGARTERGVFRQYVFENESVWKVTDNLGTVYTFGATSNAQLVNSASSTQVYRWLLSEVRDSNDNYITYTYYKDLDQIYPATITYTGHGSTDGIYQLEFLRESRTDVATSSIAGFPIHSRYRINEVQVKVNGSWERKYTLTYSTGDNGRRSMLSSITETGKDSLGTTTTLPATSFSYSTKTANWAYDATWQLPVSFVAYGATTGNHDTGARFDDFNGDGWVDVWHGTTLHLNLGTGQWSTTSPSGLSSPVNSVGADNGVRSADVDGDGLPDIVRSLNYTDINTGQGTTFAAGSEWYSDISFTKTLNGYDRDVGGRIADVNGDGLVDLVKGYGPSGTLANQNGIYLNNGAGWDTTSTNPTWLLPQAGSDADDLYFTGGDGTVTTWDFGMRFGEFNGDGLVDIIRSRSTSTPYTRIYLNDGDGTWTRIVPTGLPTEAFVSDSGVDQQAQVVDVNGDGLTDWVQTASTTAGTIVFLNRGDGSFASSTAWTDIVPDFLVDGEDAGARFVDLNADGLVDIARSYAGNKSPAGQNGVYTANGATPDLLTTITSDAGAIQRISYERAARMKEGSIPLNPRLPLSLPLVETITTDDAFGTVSTTTYSYRGGEYYYANEFDRAFAGFASTTVRDPAGNVHVTYFHQGNTSLESLGEYGDTRAKMGAVFREEQYQGTTTLLTTTLTRYASTSLSQGRSFTPRSQVLSLTHEGTAHRDYAVTFTHDATTGALASTTDYGVVTGTNTGTFTDDALGDTVTTWYTYATGTAQHIHHLPSSETIYNASSTKVSERRLYYDTLAFGSVTHGNVTKDEQWVEGSTYASTTKTYNTHGLPVTESDGNGNSTSLSYDSAALYLATSTNALGHVTHIYRDLSSGKPTRIVDSNNRSTVRVYDGLDRLIREDIPDHLNTPTDTVTKAEHTYTDTAGARARFTREYASAATSTDTYTYFDGLMRPIQIRTELSDTNSFAIKDTAYTTRGEVKSESVPYAGTGPTRTTPTTNAAYLTTYTYDALGRRLTTTTVMGTTTTSYGIALSGTTVPTFPTSSLVSHYSLDETSSVREDAHGTNDLTDNNTVGSAAGKVNTAGDFERSSSEYLRISDASQSGLDITGDMSLSTWVNIESAPTGWDNYIITGKYTGGSSEAYVLGYRSDSGMKVHFQTNAAGGGSGGNYFDWAVDLGAGTWKHLVVTFDASEADAELFVDGVSQGIGSKSETSIANNSAPYLIGASGNPANYFDGLIDEVSVWNRLITGSEVSTLYNSGLGIAYGGSSTLVTSGFTVSTTTDPLGNSKTYFTAPNGTFTRINEMNASTLYTTAYTYDPLKNLTRMVDALGNERSFSYDGLSRRVSAQDLHTTADTTFGSTTAAYDAAGNMVSEVTANGDTISYSYDALNRRLTEDSDSTGGVDVSFAYDTCTDGVGRLCIATSSGAVSSFTYSALGTTQSEARTIASTTYTTTYVHDRRGEVTSLTLPDLREVRFDHDSMGALSALSTKAQGGSFAAIVDSLAYNPMRQRTYTHVGNGLSTSHNYDSQSLYRLTSIVTATSTPTGTNTHSLDLERSSSQYASIPDASQTGLDITGDLSLSAWVNVESAPSSWANYIISGKYTGGTNEAYVLGYRDDSGMKVHFQTNASGGGSGGNYFDWAVDLGTGTWKHLAVLFDASEMSAELFVNGVSQGTVTKTESSIANNTAPFLVGASGNPANHFDGLIDDVRVWGRLLSTSTLSTLYSAPGSYSDGTDLKGKWLFDNNASDASGNGNTLTLTNTPVYSTNVPYSATSASTTLQSLSYTYDAVGNVTTLTDMGTGTPKTVQYTYDGLYRLLQASTTAASSSPYRHTFAYDALGNITAVGTSTASTTYTYGGTGYANPHAVTSVGSDTFSYDSAGNLLSDGATTYTWDYKNRLTRTVGNSATTTFGYDYTGQRVISQIASSTTVFPNKYFSVTSMQVGSSTLATSTSYIFANDQLVAYVEQDLIDGTATGTPRTFYVHPDHLGSTNVITGENGPVISNRDYLPYGSVRVESGDVSLARGYIGEFEERNNLSYLNARFYQSDRGQFLSQDPAVVNVDPTLLSDPQQLNMYSYARGNPLAFRDRDGKKVELVTRPVFSDSVGAHAFVLITNTASAASNLHGLPSSVQDATRITLGGYTNNFINGSLYKDINHSSDYDLAASDYIERTEILAPSQYKGNQADFENAVISSYSDLPSILGHYSVFGVPGFAGVGNSNNLATSILRGAGVDTSIIRGYRPLSFYPAQTPGLGTPLSSSNNSSSGSSGSGGTAFLAGQLGIGNTQGAFVGTYNFGPGAGAFNFGTGQWIK